MIGVFARCKVQTCSAPTPTFGSVTKHDLVWNAQEGKRGSDISVNIALQLYDVMQWTAAWTIFTTTMQQRCTMCDDSDADCLYNIYSVDCES